MRHRVFRHSGFLGLSMLALAGQAQAGFSQMFVFGDSLSDGGNVYAATGGLFPPAPYAARFSNGPVAVEQLAADLGLTLTPSLMGGGNYAYGGAATGNVTNAAGTYDNYIPYAYTAYPALGGLNGWTGIDDQVSSFLATPHSNLDSALFVVWGGPNDLFLSPTADTAVAAAANLAASIGSLINAGARSLLVPSMLDLSMTPEGLSADPAKQAGLSALSGLFNMSLAAQLDDLRASYSDVRLYSFDTTAAFGNLIADAGAEGFTNISDSCVQAGCFMTPGLADQYVFWDGVHPTAHTHAVLGDMFAAAVPEPQAYAMMLAGLGLMGLFARRRRTA